MFTLQNTITQIIQDSPPLFSVFFSDYFLELVPQEYRDKSLEELAAQLRLPWGMMIPSEDILKAANMILEGDRY